MPLIKSAIKKLRKDKKRTAHNRAVKERYKELLKKALVEPTVENVRRAVSTIDKAAKRHIIHSNRASRLKSRLARVQGKRAEAVKEKKGSRRKKGSVKKKSAGLITKERAVKIDNKKTKK